MIDDPPSHSYSADRSMEANEHAVDVWREEGIRWEFHRYGPGSAGSHPRHSHETYQIGYSPDFDGEYWYRGEHVPIPQGCLHILHPGEVHAPRDPRPRPRTVRFPTAYVDPALLRRARRDLGEETASSAPFVGPVVDDPELATLFLRLAASVSSAEETLRDSSLERTFFARLVARYTDRGEARYGSEKDAVKNVRAYIHAHLQKSLTLEELGEVAGLNPHYLSRVFRREVGLPPYRYVIQRRVQEAAERLARGTEIATVALETGFADQSHLTRHFKRIIGVTPGQYRPK